MFSEENENSLSCVTNYFTYILLLPCLSSPFLRYFQMGVVQNPLKYNAIYAHIILEKSLISNP
jgi:hypothetical protein